MKFSTSVVAASLAASSDAAGGGWTKAGLERKLRERALFEPMTILTYTTGSQVTDHCAIDLDQIALEEAIATKDDAGFAAAKNIYEKGGYSKSYATVTLSTGLAADIPQYTAVNGVSSSGDAVAGKAFADTTAGTTEFVVLYNTTDTMATYMNCKVGGLPNPVFDGCFADSGTLNIGGTDYTYTYDQTTDNMNDRTIAKFSTAAGVKMGEEAQPNNWIYKAYADYYGADDYGDQIVQAAFAGTATSMTGGNQDFSAMGADGKEQIIKKASAFINTLMYTMYEAEDALVVCNNGEGNDGQMYVDDIHAWDELVCFYTGSSPPGEGVLAHRLAEKRCLDWNTCNDDGTSPLNDKVFELFNVGQKQILSGDCASARATVDEYVKLWIRPLMQGTMSYAYEVSEWDTAGEKEIAEGAIFMAAVVPAVNYYDPAAAEVIYENMKFAPPGTAKPDYKAVKTALESIYDKIGTSCEEMGGFMDENGAYYPGMEPCGAGAVATSTDAGAAKDAGAAPAAAGSGAAHLVAFAAHAAMMIAAVVGLA